MKIHRRTFGYLLGLLALPLKPAPRVRGWVSSWDEGSRLRKVYAEHPGVGLWEKPVQEVEFLTDPEWHQWSISVQGREMPRKTYTLGSLTPNQPPEPAYHYDRGGVHFSMALSRVAHIRLI